jgi:hypothetical protein
MISLPLLLSGGRKQILLEQPSYKGKPATVWLAPLPYRN